MGRLTSDDEAMIAWLGRAGYATGRQVARRFYRHHTSVYRRLGMLVRGGLLAHERPFLSAGVYLPTRDGLSLVGLPVGKVTVRIATYGHDLAVVDDLIDLEHVGLRVVTEREMRYHDRLRAGEPGREDLEAEDYRVALPRGDGWHYPDLAVVDARGRRWAVEVELSAKARRRLRTILRAWTAAPVTQYAGVVYHTGRMALSGLRAAVTALHADDFVHIRPLSFGLRTFSFPAPSSSAADFTYFTRS